jgi:hypothetical protein
MKKWMLMLSCLLLTFSTLLAQEQSIQNLVGRWEAVDAENKSGGLEVVDSATIYLVYGTEKKRLAVYKADFSRKPAWFDFTIKEGGETMQMKSLISVINEDLIQWQVFQGDVRPAHFKQGEGEMMYLRRKK